MALKKAETIINEARVLASADDYGDTHGIADDYLILQFNKAIARLQKALVVTQAQPNAVYEVYAAPNAISLDIPDDCFAGNLIYGVEYSKDGSEGNYYELDIAVERGDGNVGSPTCYELVGNKLFFDSTVSSGYLRLRYERTYRAVNKIAAGVAGNSPNVAGSVLTVLQAWLDSVYGANIYYPDADSTILGLPPEYVCVVDRDGSFLCKNIRIVAYDTATGDFTLANTADATLISAFDLTNNNAFIVAGFGTSSHPDGPDVFYPYFLEYLRWEIEKKRDKIDTAAESDSVRDALSAIIEVYDQFPYGKQTIPIVR